jgi:hypothetical protein
MNLIFLDSTMNELKEVGLQDTQGYDLGVR